MKKFLLNLSLAVLSLGVLAQVNDPEKPRRIDPRQPEYAPGEVLVKFKDDISVNIRHIQNVLNTGISGIDLFIQKYKVSQCEKIYPAEMKRMTKKFITAPGGKQQEVSQLFNIYKFKSSAKINVLELVAELKKDSAVEFAEPNYFVYSLGAPVTEPDDPLYPQQPWLLTINAPAAWDSTTGDTTQVIGIIDTGVDWTHPDLASNIWINTDEIPGNGVDDDYNGFVDDVRGWDFINHDNNPMDDNSHGTHVSGIAAARGNNGIGITGVAWKARIMPVKMLQSSGSGTMADLAAAINYAANNGATIINLSLGYYTESYTVKAALENAYAGSGSGGGSILVAAAGNDGNCICEDCDLCFTMFPAAYSFVIGVMANGPGTGFSNYDPSGPIVFSNPEQYNYEIYAPGGNILSTLPFGSYGMYSGTSMAAPMVSGAIALMRSYDPLQSGETLLCRLIQGATDGTLNIFNSLDPILIPQLIPLDITLHDTLPGCNRNNIANAGEQVNYTLTIQNSGGWADSVRVIMSLQNPGDSVEAVITDSLCYLGDISPYGSIPSTGPLVLTISPNSLHHTRIPLKFLIISQNAPTITLVDTIDVFRTDLLHGRLDSTLVLTPDKRWIVYPWFYIEPTGALILQPGTELELEQGINNYGSIICQGTPDSLVRIFGPYGIRDGNFSFTYTEFNNTGCLYGSGNFRHCILNNTSITGGFYDFSECVFNNCSGAIRYMGTMKRCNFINCRGVLTAYWAGCLDYSFCNFSQTSNFGGPYFFHGNGRAMTGNNFLDGPGIQVFNPPNGDVFELNPQYWGTADTAKIDKKIMDFWDDPSLPIVRYQPILIKPSDSAHGIVWKVLLNGIDPQDEQLDPIGPGLVKFDVYFNRPMDINYPPRVTFSAWEPYTHRVVSDSASWNNDSTIWTAYYNIINGTGDGINVIKVSGARDDEGWEIPPEFNNRFQFVVQAASAAALDFTAQAGLDQVTLKWPPATSSDFLGYNLYRYKKINDSLVSDTARINAQLITDTAFIDQNLLTGFTYYYFYKILGTDFRESERSKIVFAMPFSAQNGDANGDMVVNVLDITTLIYYILGRDPIPFVFYAADVNNDNFADILDVIGVVNIILGLKQTPLSDQAIDTNQATINLEANEIYLNSKGNVAALYFELACKEPEKINLTSRIPGFELASAVNGDRLRCVIYSLLNQPIPAGIRHLITLNEEVTCPSWGNVAGGDPNGFPVKFIANISSGFQQKEFTLYAIPNPFRKQVSIYYRNPVPASGEWKIFDISGNLISIEPIPIQDTGEHCMIWDAGRVKQGTYTGLMTLKTLAGEIFHQNVKLIMVND